MLQIYNDLENLSFDERRDAFQNGDVNIFSLMLSDHEGDDSDTEETTPSQSDDKENNGINKFTTFTSNNTPPTTFISANLAQLSPILDCKTPTNFIDDSDCNLEWIGTCCTEDFSNTLPKTPQKTVINDLQKTKEPVQPYLLDFENCGDNSILVNGNA